MHATTTADQLEREKFNHLARTWWDPEGPMWPLHGMNRFRAQHIVPLLQQHFDLPDSDLPLKGLKILDIGCGGGLMSESMAKLGATVHGIDVAEKNIQVAIEHAKGSDLPVTYEAVEARVLLERDNVYDVVLNLEVVEHVSDLKLFLQQCNHLLAKDGLTVMSTINRTFKSWLFAIIGAEYVLNLLPR